MLGKRYCNDEKAILKLNDLQNKMKDQVTEKVKSGIYKFEKVPCCVCGKETFEKLAEKDRYGLLLHVVVCKECGLVQSNPRMNQESYNRFYESEYRKLYVGTERPAEFFFDGQVKQGEKIEKFLLQHGHGDLKGKLVLEVGCGAGGILKHLRDRGAQVIGCDLGSEYLSYGRSNYDLELVHGPLNAIKPDVKADVLIYSHVFEHILDVEAELTAVKERLADDGILYIEIPGIHNIANTYKADFLRLLQNAHTFHFTLTSLDNLFSKYGFELLYGTEYVQSIFVKGEARESYENEYEGVVKAIEAYEARRKFHKISFSNILRVVRLNFRRLVKIVG